MFEQLTSICQELLIDFEGAEEVSNYINSRLSKSTQKEFNLGYFPSSPYFYTLINSLGLDELTSSNLFYYHFNANYDFSSDGGTLCSSLEHHNLVMPYRDVYGKIVALVGRTLLLEQDRQKANIPKYKNTSFSKGHHLFGLYQAKQSILDKGCAIVVEGQFDCMTAHSFGIKNVIALGGSGMTFEQMMLLSRYTNNVMLMLDNDEAGRLGIKRAKDQFSKYVSSVKELNLPEGYKDLDEFLSAGNGDAVEWVNMMTA